MKCTLLSFLLRIFSPPLTIVVAPYIGLSCALFSTFRRRPGPRGEAVHSCSISLSGILQNPNSTDHSCVLASLDASAVSVRVPLYPLPEGFVIWVCILRRSLVTLWLALDIKCLLSLRLAYLPFPHSFSHSHVCFLLSSLP